MKRSGFTLIELSIVLVIIGLIVGGVLVGQDLIKGAELRATVRTIEQLQAAKNTFRIKYNCIPGDCADASTKLTGAFNGNGNRVITATDADFLTHLSLANFIVTSVDGNSSTIISVPLGSSVLYLVGQSGAYTVADGLSVLALLGPYNASDGFHRHTLTPLQARDIDQKTDDGLPETGRTLHTYETDEGLRYDASVISAGNSGDGVSCLTDDTTPVQYNNLGSAIRPCGLAFDINRW